MHRDAWQSVVSQRVGLKRLSAHACSNLFTVLLKCYCWTTEPVLNLTCVPNVYISVSKLPHLQP